MLNATHAVFGTKLKRISNDIVIVLQKHLYSYGLANHYGLKGGRTAILFPYNSIFFPATISHEVGHLLGANHPDSDEGIFLFYSILKYIKFFIKWYFSSLGVTDKNFQLLNDKIFLCQTDI